ncbi:MAG: DUF1501 domain-containing protein [Planctomycetia bacterium]|nr:DUF1501 domain-containing protein [Planctomycetia bacterium]
MLTVLGHPQRVCTGLTRRKLLQVGGAGLFGLSLPNVLAAEEAQSARKARAKSVIFVFLFGGPSQLETFDMKPDAASGIRGPFRPIAARTPGLRICEHLPRLAAASDRYCVVRTVNHAENSHNACHHIQTGHPLPPADRGAANVDATDKDWPAMGSVVEYLDQRAAGDTPRMVPSYVYLPQRLGHFAGYDYSGQYAGWLGRAYNPVTTDIRKRDAADNPYFRACTDAELDFRLSGLATPVDVTLDRLDRRKGLLEQFDDRRRQLDAPAATRDFQRLREQALTLVTSEPMRVAFDIRRESDRLRDRYGRNLFGQSLLMGRRVVEAGGRFVNVLWDVAVRGDNFAGWDSHEGLQATLKDHLLPGLDQGLSALLEDMSDRGLLDETLVVCLGEIGRTPKFQNRGNADGRDHWSYCFPCLLAGAGVRGGIAYGRSDKDAAYPVDRPVSPEDLASTIFDSLGIDPHEFIQDKQGRPVKLVEGGRPLAVFG